MLSIRRVQKLQREYDRLKVSLLLLVRIFESEKQLDQIHAIEFEIQRHTAVRTVIQYEHT